MDELQALLGDSYKEGMTLEEVGEFFKGKNFKDLSTGNYVDKSKFDNKINELTQQLADKDTELNAKLSDDEKKQKNFDNQAKEIARLQKLLQENTINGNRNVVEGTLVSTKELLGIVDTDNDFSSFVSNIVSEDANKSKEIASYVVNLVKNSYEKGKQDATKNNMGSFGKGKNGGEDSNPKDEIGEIGKRIAKNNVVGTPTYDYFAKK